MKESYRNKIGLSAANKERLEIINKIIEEYQDAGYQLTLRQLYYQLVSRDIIQNNAKEYAKLSDLLVKGRMAGVVDWDAIVDRVRVPKIPYYVSGVPDAITDTIEQYRLDRMKDQDVYIEVWVEKDALSEVLSRVTEKYHIRLMVNKGYTSCTAMHDAYERFSNAADEGKQLYILYVGDHDPSGLDMIRDIAERLKEFTLADLHVEPLALTTAQVKKYNPPPNPAKMKDPRSGNYVSEFGRVSWEVDALRPEVLHKIVEQGILKHINLELYAAKLKQEEKDKKQLQKFGKAA